MYNKYFIVDITHRLIFAFHHSFTLNELQLQFTISIHLLKSLKIKPFSFDILMI